MTHLIALLLPAYCTEQTDRQTSGTRHISLQDLDKFENVHCAATERGVN